jgi:hypothetical protein
LTRRRSRPALKQRLRQELGLEAFNEADRELIKAAVRARHSARSAACADKGCAPRGAAATRARGLTRADAPRWPT